MPPGQNLGLRAKVEAEIDRQASRKLTQDVEQAIEQAESSVTPTADGSFRGRTMPGGGGGGLGGATGGAAAGAATRRGSLSSLAGSSAAAGGAAVLGTVFLGGVVATKMLQKMTEASGKMSASASMLGAAVDLFFKPYGDFLGSMLMPLSKSLLKAAVNINKSVSENGLLIAGWKNLLDTMNNLPGELGKIMIQSVGQGLESLFGENDFFTEMQDFEWSDHIPIVKWDDFVGGAFDMVRGEWPGWPGIKTDWPGWPDIPTDPFSGFTANIQTAEEALDGFIDWLGRLPGVDVGTGRGGRSRTPGSAVSSGSGGGSRARTNTERNARNVERLQTRGSGGGSGGGSFDPDLNPFQPGNQDVNDIQVRLEANGRRLFEETQRNANNLLDRL